MGAALGTIIAIIITHHIANIEQCLGRRPRLGVHRHVGHAHVDAGAGKQIAPGERNHRGYSDGHDQAIVPQGLFKR